MKMVLFAANNLRHFPASRLAGTMAKFVQERWANGGRKVVVSFSELDTQEADALAYKLQAARSIFYSVGKMKEAISRLKKEYQYDVVVTVTGSEEAEDLFRHYCQEADVQPELLPKVEWWRGFAFVDTSSHVPHYGCVPHSPSTVPPRS